MDMLRAVRRSGSRKNENKYEYSMKDSGLAKGNTKTKRLGLFWFRHDLRLHDQNALHALCDKVDSVTFLYVIDKSAFETNEYGMNSLGSHRQRFLHQTLADLAASLGDRGHHLHIFIGEPVTVISQLIETMQYSHLGVTYHGGYNEIKQVQKLKALHPCLTFVQQESCSLFNLKALPFSIDDMPNVFSPFRKKVEKACTVSMPSEDRINLPSPCTPNHINAISYPIEHQSTETQVEGKFLGGETAALHHLHQYLFHWKSAASYKETRNALDNWRFSTKLSPWLACGAISPKVVVKQLKLFEAAHVKNDSTYWIYFELLWREFFYWLQQKYGHHWFRFKGIQNKTPATNHHPDTFKAWCNGETGYPIVDACMRQLAETGYMSNRGRQLVASCFVHELKQDWRYGAAWFEHQLIDYDVGSNWGNWMYLAGVGADPRGHRQFDLAKQTLAYDPNGEFCHRWLKQGGKPYASDT
jgi:deoxyribodipyrimidine photo-lyase